MYHYVFITEFGTTSGWGDSHTLISFFNINIITNVNFFLLFGVTGCFVIVVTSINTLRHQNETKKSSTSPHHQKNIQSKIVYYNFVFITYILSIFFLTFVLFFVFYLGIIDFYPNTDFFIIIGASGFFTLIILEFLSFSHIQHRSKQGMVISFFLVFIGLIGYYDFKILEPFLGVYLLIIFIFYKIVSYYVQREYPIRGFRSSIDLMPWDNKTKEILYNYNETGSFEISIILIILTLFILLFLLIKNPMSLFSRKTITRVHEISIMNFTYDLEENKYLFRLVALLLGNLLISFLVMTLEESKGDLEGKISYLIISLLLILVIPIIKRNLLIIPIAQSKFFTITLFDIYIGVFLGLCIITLNFLLIPISIVLIITRLLTKSDQTMENNKEISFTLATIGNLLILLAFLFYLGWWLLDSKYEGTGLNLFCITLICRYGFSFLRTFSNPSLIRYIIRRIIIIIPMFVGISIVVYGMLTFAGNPIDLLMSGQQCGNNPDCRAQTRAILEERFGLNDSPAIQWFNWFFHFLMGDFGEELVVGLGSVSKTIFARTLPTVELALIPTVLSLLISIPLGIIAAKRQYSLVDNSVAILVAFGVSVPIFFFIIVLILVLSLNMGILPSFGRELVQTDISSVNLEYIDWWLKGIPLEINIGFGEFNYYLKITTIQINDFISFSRWDLIFHWIIPVIAITLLSLALFTRLVRSGMLEVMRQDYILSARASGFSENLIVRKFALRNALIPVITFLGLALGNTLGGAPITETVISWPGLGRYAVEALVLADYAPIMATTMIVAVMIMLANLFTDILYSIIDPRIRIE
jgi:peptide/nickel transport system permease protein